MAAIRKKGRERATASLCCCSATAAARASLAMRSLLSVHSPGCRGYGFVSALGCSTTRQHLLGGLAGSGCRRDTACRPWRLASAIQATQVASADFSSFAMLGFDMKRNSYLAR